MKKFVVASLLVLFTATAFAALPVSWSISPGGSQSVTFDIKTYAWLFAEPYAGTSDTRITVTKDSNVECSMYVGGFNNGSCRIGAGRYLIVIQHAAGEGKAGGKLTYRME